MDIINIIYFICGAMGALSKDILKDNTLQLPHKKNGEFFLGFLGGAIIGGIAGIVADGNPSTAFLGGYAGTAILENLVNKKDTIKNIDDKEINTNKKVSNESIQDLIKRIAIEKKVNPKLALEVAKCESSFNPKATNTNKNGTIDRGLFQINDYWHPHVSDKQAFDPEFSTNFFCDAVKQNNLYWWNASKSCWGHIHALT